MQHPGPTCCVAGASLSISFTQGRVEPPSGPDAVRARRGFNPTKWEMAPAKRPPNRGPATLQQPVLLLRWGLVPLHQVSCRPLGHTY